MNVLNTVGLCVLSLGLLSACASTIYPSVSTPNLPKQSIALLLKFPEGSECRMNTSQGVLVQASIPGKFEFPNADRMAPVSCKFPDGTTYGVTAHNFVPENSKSAGITVYPDGSAYITSSTTDGNLVQLQPTGTVIKR